MLEEVLKEATIRHGNDEHAILNESMSFGNRYQSMENFIIYSTSCKWFYTSFTATQKSRFFHFTPQRASLELDGTLSSILSFQLNRPVGEKYYQYKPSEKVVSRSKKVTQNTTRNIPVQTREHTIKLWIFHVYLKCRNISCETIQHFSNFTQV